MRQHASTLVQKGPSPFPAHFWVKLKLCQTTTMTITGPGNYYPTAIGYVGNGCYDTYTPTGGPTPLWFAEMAARYGSYLVMDVEYWLTAFQTSAGSECLFAGVWCGTDYDVANGDDPTGKTLKQIKERTTANVRRLPFGGGAIQNQAKFHGKVSLHKAFGVSAQEYKTEDKYASLTTTNPLSKFYITPFIVDGAGTSTFLRADWTLTLRWTVQFFDLKKAATGGGQTHQDDMQ